MEGFGIGWQWQPMIIALSMMVLDIIFGFAGAWKNNEVRSDKMREGLWHKAGYCGLIMLAFSYEVGSEWVNFESAQVDLGILLPVVPAVTGVCAFIFATEVVSIIENLCELNPKIADIKAFNMFMPHDPNKPDITVALEDGSKNKEDKKSDDDDMKKEGTD